MERNYYILFCLRYFSITLAFSNKMALCSDAEIGAKIVQMFLILFKNAWEATFLRGSRNVSSMVLQNLLS